MAQRQYKMNLRDAPLALLSSDQTRTIIGSTSGEAPAAKDRPGITYAHNVMPTKEGITSIGYLNEVAPIPGLVGTVLDVRTIYSTSGERVYIAFSSIGATYVLRSGSSVWLATSENYFQVPDFDLSRITVGTVNRVSYIHLRGIGAVTYNSEVNILLPVTLSGIDLPNVIGIIGSSGYLIAYTANSVGWSSLLDPTDFVPSSTTGAGGGNVADLAGNIIFATANSVGILIYTEANVVAATYSGNSKYPFTFREVADSKGGIGLDLVAHEANSQYQFVFSKAGLQTVDSNKAEVILPELSDFLAGKIIEDFDEATNTYILTKLVTSMRKKIKYIASRYLVVSYGQEGFTHALVVDTALQRLGKLKIDHADIFEYLGPQSEVSKQSIGVALANGQVKVVNFSETWEDSSGLAILGKLQYVRSHGLQLLAVEVEDIDEDDEFTLKTLVSLDGKNYSSSVEAYLNVAESGYRQYYLRATGKSHSLLLAGKFNLSTLQIVYSTAGRR